MGETFPSPSVEVSLFGGGGVSFESGVSFEPYELSSLLLPPQPESINVAAHVAKRIVEWSLRWLSIERISSLVNGINLLSWSLSEFVTKLSKLIAKTDFNQIHSKKFNKFLLYDYIPHNISMLCVSVFMVLKRNDSK